MNPFASFSFTQLLWLVPIFFALHNMEEAPFMANWSKKLPVKIHPAVSTRQFVAAVSVLTLIGFLLTYLGIAQIPQPTGYLIILEIQMALAFNAIIPHLFVTLRFRQYNPGLATALLVNVPFSFHLFQQALNSKIIEWSQVWHLLALAPFVSIIAIIVSLSLGKWVVTILFPPAEGNPTSI